MSGTHLAGRLGGCASEGHQGAITDPADFHRVDCPVCLPALRGLDLGDGDGHPIELCRTLRVCTVDPTRPESDPATEHRSRP